MKRFLSHSVAARALLTPIFLGLGWAPASAMMDDEQPTQRGVWTTPRTAPGVTDDIPPEPEATQFLMNEDPTRVGKANAQSQQDQEAYAAWLAQMVREQLLREEWAASLGLWQSAVRQRAPGKALSVMLPGEVGALAGRRPEQIEAEVTGEVERAYEEARQRQLGQRETLAAQARDFMAQASRLEDQITGWMAQLAPEAAPTEEQLVEMAEFERVLGAAEAARQQQAQADQALRDIDAARRRFLDNPRAVTFVSQLMDQVQAQAPQPVAEDMGRPQVTEVPQWVQSLQNMYAAQRQRAVEALRQKAAAQKGVLQKDHEARVQRREEEETRRTGARIARDSEILRDNIASVIRAPYKTAIKTTTLQRLATAANKRLLSVQKSLKTLSKESASYGRFALEQETLQRDLDYLGQVLSLYGQQAAQEQEALKAQVVAQKSPPAQVPPSSDMPDPTYLQSMKDFYKRQSDGRVQQLKNRLSGASPQDTQRILKQFEGQLALALKTFGEEMRTASRHDLPELEYKGQLLAAEQAFVRSKQAEIQRAEAEAQRAERKAAEVERALQDRILRDRKAKEAVQKKEEERRLQELDPYDVDVEEYVEY